MRESKAGDWPRHVRWRPAKGAGLEHVTLSETQQGYSAHGVAVGARGGAPYGLTWRVKTDRGWNTTALWLMNTDGESVALASDGAGNWHDADGEPLPAFAGCLFPDIAATPFTNTLPIRRLGLDVGESARIRVLYLPVPSLVPEVVEQRYTRLAPRRWLYEGLFRGFQAELEVDADGIVLDYPETFLRIEPEV